MGAHESSLLSLLQTETGPSTWSRSPASPPFFGHFMAPVGAISLGAAALADPRRPSSEVLLAVPPQIDVRPDLVAYVNASVPAPAVAGAGASTASSDEALPPQGGAFSRAAGAASTVWV